MMQLNFLGDFIELFFLKADDKDISEFIMKKNNQVKVK